MMIDRSLGSSSLRLPHSRCVDGVDQVSEKDSLGPRPVSSLGVTSSARRRAPPIHSSWALLTNAWAHRESVYSAI